MHSFGWVEHVDPLNMPIQQAYQISATTSVPTSGGSRGGKSGHGPPIEIGNGVWTPLRDRKSNGSIVILLKSKDFGPPVAMSATDLAPPMEKYHRKHEKGR